jgi:hypothetical protein
MSGGLFYNHDSEAKDYIFNWSDKPTNVFEDREISELVWDVFDLIHSFDYYKSCDTSKETYLKDKKEFKKKWFGTNRGLQIRKIVDGSIEDLRQELYETFGLSEEVKNEV